MEARIAAVTAAIAAATRPIPRERSICMFGADLSCELGECRDLLGTPYGRFIDLPLSIRDKIARMLGRYVLIGATPVEWPMCYCFYCAGVVMIDPDDMGTCAIGRCAAMWRYRDTWLGHLPRDIWLEVVAFVAHAGISRKLTGDIPYRYRDYDGEIEEFRSDLRIVCNLCSE